MFNVLWLQEAFANKWDDGPLDMHSCGTPHANVRLNSMVAGSEEKVQYNEA